MTHEVPSLPYDYNALEPYIDEQTMRIHHDKHHQAYVDKLNAALTSQPSLQEKQVADLIANLNTLPDEVKTAIRNNGGGHYNHSLFWEIMTPNAPAEPSGEIAEAIKQSFNSFEEFKKKFSEAAAARFGSGWAWLVINNGELEIVSTANQDSPLTDGKQPILGIDVWEHSYYIKYMWNRPEYIENFFKVINWNKVNELYTKAKQA